MDTETQETTIDGGGEFNQDAPQPTLDQKLAKVVKKARRVARKAEGKHLSAAKARAKGQKAASAKAKGAKPAKAAKTAQKAPPQGAETKGAKIEALLRRTDGATMQQLMKETDWQPHSVRGFISTLNRKHKLKINSEKNDGGVRVYSIS